MTTNKPCKGDILIAEPSLNDSDFNRSIIYLTEHGDQGSVGFIINKKLDLTLKDIVPDLPFSIPVYKGGPVEQDSLYFIHAVPEKIPNSVAINDKHYWGGDFEILKELLLSGKVKTNEVRFFLGYSGWSPDQLYAEILRNSWVVCNNIKDIFTTQADELWKIQLRELGGDYLLWINAPENPQMN